MESSIKYEATTLYDRQIRLWGIEAQKKMSSLHVLFIGCTCANIEAAKNLVLSGVNISLTTGDISEKYESLTRSHMFLNSLVSYEEKVQLPQTDFDAITHLSVNALKNLNPLTRTSFLSSNEWQQMVAQVSKNTQTLKEYDILVVDRMCVSDIGIDVLNEACRDSQKGFFCCHSLGLHGAIFKDLGLRLSRENASYPSFRQVIRTPYSKLPSGFSSSTKQIPHAKLVAYFAFLNKSSDSITGILENIGHTQKNISEAEQWLSESRKHEHVPNAVQACVLGGIIAEEIQMYMSEKGRELHNIFLFDGNVHEGIIFNVQINEDKYSSANFVNFHNSNIVL